MNDEVTLMIHCGHCGKVWDIDNDPESCTCDTDADWQLVVVDDD